LTLWRRLVGTERLPVVPQAVSPAHRTGQINLIVDSSRSRFARRTRFVLRGTVFWTTMSRSVLLTLGVRYLKNRMETLLVGMSISSFSRAEYQNVRTNVLKCSHRTSWTHCGGV